MSINLKLQKIAPLAVLVAFVPLILAAGTAPSAASATGSGIAATAAQQQELIQNLSEGDIDWPKLVS